MYDNIRRRSRARHSSRRAAKAVAEAQDRSGWSGSNSSQADPTGCDRALWDATATRARQRAGIASESWEEPPNVRTDSAAGRGAA